MLSASFAVRIFVRPFSSADYQSYTKNTYDALEAALSNPKRFMSIEDRVDFSNHTFDTIRRQCRGRFFTRHRDCLLLKSPEDIVIYQQFLQIVKPRTIVEFGSATGGSALWLSDMATLYDIKCEVFSYDIDLSLIQDNVKRLKPDTVTFIEGDSYKIETLFDEKFLLEMPRPFVLIEDCHHNSNGIMHFFHQYMKAGDYMIMEDTHAFIPLMSRMDADDSNFEPWMSNGKLEVVKKFLTEHKDQYLVDTFFTDFFGYNFTWNINAWIRKMK